ncbi:MAG: hypothetical protein U9Q77_04740 [Candidatus Marinimicrobia bacterium]|nr:hypothetical protein [Candidatus Neomarinimicrobiota bacterium]
MGNTLKMEKQDMVKRLSHWAGVTVRSIEPPVYTVIQFQSIARNGNESKQLYQLTVLINPPVTTALLMLKSQVKLGHLRGVTSAHGAGWPILKCPP